MGGVLLVGGSAQAAPDMRVNYLWFSLDGRNGRTEPANMRCSKGIPKMNHFNIWFRIVGERPDTTRPQKWEAHGKLRRRFLLGQQRRHGSSKGSMYLWQEPN